jgi:hypothetical protein
MDLPLRAFPNWVLRITCERCFKDRMLSAASAPPRQRDMPLGVLIARARYDGCGGCWQGGAADWYRGCQQPPGAAHRAAKQLIRCFLWCG